MQVNVDDELAYIIAQMQRDPLTDKAIRNYAKAVVGVKPNDVQEWAKTYQARY